MDKELKNLLPSVLCLIGDLLGCRLLWKTMANRDFVEELLKKLLGNKEFLTQINPDLQNVDINTLNLTPLVDELYQRVQLLTIPAILLLLGFHSVVYFFAYRGGFGARKYLGFYSISATLGLVASAFLQLQPSSVKYLLWAALFGFAYYQNRVNLRDQLTD